MTHIGKSVDLETFDALTSPGASAGRDNRTGLPGVLASLRRLSWKKALLAGAAIVVVAGAADLGANYWTTGRFQQSTDDAYVKADTTIIAPKVSGYLSEVLVADNEHVKAGQPLARIDDRDYAAALARADADVAASDADIAGARANLEEQLAVIAQARSTVAVDRANIAYAEQDSDRYGSLARSGAGSVQNQQQATTKLQVAQATLQRDAASVLAAERRSDVLRTQVAKAEASLARARAVRDQAALSLSDTTIKAPVDGMVGNRSLRLGQFVQAGTQLMAVVPTNGVYVVANFKETQLTNVRPGQEVAIGVDMFPGAPIKGHIDSIAPASGQEFALLPPDNATGNFTKIVQRIPVKITLDDGALSGLLRPGMSVTPTVDTKAGDTKAGDTKAAGANGTDTKVSDTRPRDTKASDSRLGGANTSDATTVPAHRVAVK